MKQTFNIGNIPSQKDKLFDEMKKTLIDNEIIDANIPDDITGDKVVKNVTEVNEYIKDIKQALVEKGAATELTPNAELGEIVENTTLLKPLLDCTKKTVSMFVNNGSESIDGLISYNDTENVTDMSSTFSGCMYLKSIPKLNTKKVKNFRSMFSGCFDLASIPELDTSSGVYFDSMFSGCSDLASIPELDTSSGTDFRNMFQNCEVLASIPNLDTSSGVHFDSMFKGCSALASIPELDTSSGTDFSNMFEKCTKLKIVPPLNTSKGVSGLETMFSECYELETILGIDLSAVSSGYRTSDMFYKCRKLQNLTLTNIKCNITIGSGDGSNYSNHYGYLLTLDSLINTCKECIKMSSTCKLTIGSANLEKIANVYVRFVDRTQTEIAVGEKGDVVVCEADNNDAMTITEYMALKNWTLA